MMGKFCRANGFSSFLDLTTEFRVFLLQVAQFGFQLADAPLLLGELLERLLVHLGLGLEPQVGGGELGLQTVHLFLQVFLNSQLSVQNLFVFIILLLHFKLKLVKFSVCSYQFL